MDDLARTEDRWFLVKRPRSRRKAKRRTRVEVRGQFLVQEKAEVQSFKWAARRRASSRGISEKPS